MSNYSKGFIISLGVVTPNNIYEITRVSVLTDRNSNGEPLMVTPYFEATNINNGHEWTFSFDDYKDKVLSFEQVISKLLSK